MPTPHVAPLRTLIVGAGALGGLLAARMRASGAPVSLATRDAPAAARLEASGLRVTGIGGSTAVSAAPVAPLDDYVGREAFDVIVIATKAHDAMEVAPRAARLLAAEGALVPIQNGGVATALARQLGDDRVLGGLSNLGATMVAPGVYEQRNAGHLLVGEVAGGASARADRVAAWLGRGVEVRVTANLLGAVWSKLLINCSVTTLGAIAGQTMRGYIGTRDGRELFDLTYDEALAVALASGARPERMLVEPVPPSWNGRSALGPAHDAWLDAILRGYGDLKPSMLQDFERGRTTEVDFINGYVLEQGRQAGVPTPANAAIVEVVHAISARRLAPSPDLLGKILQMARRRG